MCGWRGRRPTNAHWYSLFENDRYFIRWLQSSQERKRNVLMVGCVQNVFQNHYVNPTLKQVTARPTFLCPVLYRKMYGYAAATRDIKSVHHPYQSEHTHTHTHTHTEGGSTVFEPYEGPKRK